MTYGNLSHAASGGGCFGESIQGAHERFPPRWLTERGRGSIPASSLSLDSLAGRVERSNRKVIDPDSNPNGYLPSNRQNWHCFTLLFRSRNQAESYETATHITCLVPSSVNSVCGEFWVGGWG